MVPETAQLQDQHNRNVPPFSPFPRDHFDISKLLEEPQNVKGYNKTKVQKPHFEENASTKPKETSTSPAWKG